MCLLLVICTHIVTHGNKDKAKEGCHKSVCVTSTPSVLLYPAYTLETIHVYVYKKKGLAQTASLTKMTNSYICTGVYNSYLPCFPVHGVSDLPDLLKAVCFGLSFWKTIQYYQTSDTMYNPWYTLTFFLCIISCRFP